MTDSDILESIDNLPDISFIDDMTLTDVQARIFNAFYRFYEQITGKRITLSRADPYRVMMLACSQVIYQGLQQVDKAGKMNFLKYSYGDFLKNLAAFKKVFENEPEKASVKVRWKLAEPRESATPIPAGSRVTADYAVYLKQKIIQRYRPETRRSPSLCIAPRPGSRATATWPESLVLWSTRWRSLRA